MMTGCQPTTPPRTPNQSQPSEAPATYAPRATSSSSTSIPRRRRTSARTAGPTTSGQSPPPQRLSAVCLSRCSSLTGGRTRWPTSQPWRSRRTWSSPTNPNTPTGQTMAESAVFDRQDHCREAGWATYQSRRRSLRCLFGHDFPNWTPTPPNGYSPSNYDRCFRCRAPIKWYAFGQHRWGGLAAHIDGKVASREGGTSGS